MEARQVVVDLTRPRRMRRLVGVVEAPREVLEGGRIAAEESGDLRVDDTGHPANDIHVSTREAPGAVKDADGLFHPSQPAPERYLTGITRSQGTDEIGRAHV